MTDAVMNVFYRKIAIGMVSLVVGGALNGCVGKFNPENDATSPIAPRIQAVVDANREYPRWENFPRSSDPAPQPVAIAAQVGALTAASGALAQDVSRIEWTLTDDPAAFAAAARARVDSVQVAPVTQDTEAEIEAFARRMRERGRAPPPVDRR